MWEVLSSAGFRLGGLWDGPVGFWVAFPRVGGRPLAIAMGATSAATGASTDVVNGGFAVYYGFSLGL